jgi:hypothetical protein
MAERGSAVVAWAAGISAAAATFAGIAASRATPLLRNAWFIAWLAVALIAFVLLLVAGLPDLVGWLQERKSEPEVAANAPAARDNIEPHQLPTATVDHPLTDAHATEAEYATMSASSSSESPRSDAQQAGVLEELERLVVARYPSAAAIERLLDHSGIDPRMLDMSGAVRVVAHRGLQFANEQGRLQDLISAMRRDYPNDSKLNYLLAGTRWQIPLH